MKLHQLTNGGPHFGLVCTSHLESCQYSGLVHPVACGPFSSLGFKSKLFFGMYKSNSPTTQSIARHESPMVSNTPLLSLFKHLSAYRHLRPQRNLSQTMLQTCELICNCRAVPTKIWTTPSHNQSICQDRSKGPISRLNLLNTLELILDCRAITTGIWIAP